MLKKSMFLLIFAVWTSVFASGVNLEVSERRVMGTARGLAEDKNNLQRQAVANARGNADILLEPNFFLEQDGDSILVTVTGLQARYVVAKTGIAEAVILPAEVNAVKPVETKVEAPKIARDFGSGIYASIKAQTAIPWSSMGGNLQIGYFQNRTFWGFDFSIGKGAERNSWSNDTIINLDDYYFMSGGLSFGGRIKPNDYFQAVLGASIGAFTKFEDDVIESGNKSNDWIDTRRRSREWVMAQGPFAKFIFGSGNLKFEVSNRAVFGMGYGAFIMEAGVVYAR
ncbi:MAG: hypothetical protein FWE23_04095 [Chitinivibrionia bacterium]|nr:hypothetical protein [Chitinivibrionia bacterium]